MTEWTAIQAFMNAVVPWPASPQDAGWVNLHWSFPVPDKKDPTKTILLKSGGAPTKEIGSFISRVNWSLQYPARIKDMWFCTSLQAATTIKKNGKIGADRSKANALKLKSIWIDIDIKSEKPEKNYVTEADALDALKSFIVKVGLPPPSALVRSGGGLHVYWISKAELRRRIGFGMRRV
jgi:hypothetical protein